MMLLVKSPVEKHIGAAGMNNDTAMQFVHLCWNLQEKLGESFPSRWKKANQSEFPGKMSNPLMMRWWHVACASKHLLRNWSQWKVVAISTRNEFEPNSHAGDVSRKLLAMFSERKFEADLLFITAYFDSFVNRHLKLLQSTCKHTKDYGYRARNVPLHDYIMFMELNNLASNWETHPAFDDFREVFNSLPSNDVLSVDEAANVNAKFVAPGQNVMRKQINGFFSEAKLLFLLTSIAGAHISAQFRLFPDNRKNVFRQPTSSLQTESSHRSEY
eukprot:scaffold108996_cov66-Attheya_sp.AAC.4